MKNYLRTLSVLLTAIFMVNALSGCSERSRPSDVTGDGTIVYNTDDSIDALNYVGYINREINQVLGILSVHMTNADSLEKGAYIAADEIESVRESLEKVGESIDSVEYLNPPADYESDRTATLRRLENAQNTLEAYLDALENEESTEIKDFIDLMQGDYVSLSNSFNIAQG